LSGAECDETTSNNKKRTMTPSKANPKGASRTKKPRKSAPKAAAKAKVGATAARRFG
jgi:hypothetical protein